MASITVTARSHRDCWRGAALVRPHDLPQPGARMHSKANRNSRRAANHPRGGMRRAGWSMNRIRPLPSTPVPRPVSAFQRRLPRPRCDASHWLWCQGHTALTRACAGVWISRCTGPPDESGLATDRWVVRLGPSTHPGSTADEQEPDVPPHCRCHVALNGARWCEGAGPTEGRRAWFGGAGWGSRSGVVE